MSNLPGMTLYTPPRRRGGIMSSKYATPPKEDDPSPVTTCSLSTRLASSQKDPNSSPLKSSAVTYSSSVMLASPQEFLRNKCASPKLPQSGVLGEDVAKIEPLRKRLPNFLILTPEPAPSTSFWVPNFARQTGKAEHEARSSADQCARPNRLMQFGSAATSASVEADESPSQSCASFNAIPERALAHIFCHLPRKSHQRSFVLSNKRCYHSLVSHFYTNIRVLLDDFPTNQHIIADLAAPDGKGGSLNLGIRHMRKLEFVAFTPALIPSGAGILARLLINVISKTQLHWFSWPVDVAIDPSILWDLWHPTQPSIMQLTNLQITEAIWSGAVVKGTKDALVRFLQSNAGRLQHIEISAATEVGLENVATLLQKMRKYSGPLETLCLDLRAFQSCTDPNNAEDPISTHLFGPLRTIRSPLYEDITRLVFKGVNLADSTLLKVISLRRLHHLEILRCPFAGRLLEGAAKAASATLQCLKIDHDVEDALLEPFSDPEDPTEISHALRLCFSVFDFCIQTLHVRLKGHSPFLSDDLKAHYPNLFSLYFDCVDSAPRCRTEQTQETRNAVVRSSALTTNIFGHGTTLPYCDLAVAVAGNAWSNSRQVRDALLEQGNFHSAILGFATPVVLTLIITRSTLCLLYDNPAQRLTNSSTQASNEVLEAVFAQKIAMATFTIESQLRTGKSTASSDTGSTTNIRNSTLKIIVIEVEIEGGATMKGAGSSNCSPEDCVPTLHQTNGARSSSKVGSLEACPLSATDVSNSPASALLHRAPSVKRYIFAKGTESVVINDTVTQRTVAVSLAEHMLQRMDVDMPIYFNGTK